MPTAPGTSAIARTGLPAATVPSSEVRRVICGERGQVFQITGWRPTMSGIRVTPGPPLRRREKVRNFLPGL